MSVSSNFVVVAGLTLVGVTSGAIASVVVLTGIFTPLSFRFALGVATPFAALSALALHKAILA